jgi:hypothetical protein
MERFRRSELKRGRCAVSIHLKVDKAGAHSVWKLSFSAPPRIVKVRRVGGIVDTDSENTGVKRRVRLGHKKDVAAILDPGRGCHATMSPR